MGLNVRGEKKLANIFKFGISERRLYFWLQQRNEFKVIFGKYASTKKDSFITNVICELIESDRNLFNALKMDIKISLVPDDYFKWISSNIRQLNWINQYTNNINLGYANIFSDTQLDLRENIILKVDFLNGDITDKRNYIERLNKEWIYHVDNDGITNWLKGKNEALVCEHAWECINRTIEKLVIPCYPTENFTDLLLFIDQVQINKHEVIKLIGRIKNGWNQKKYREKNTGKKQCNLLLSKKATDRLSKLAEAYEISKSDIVEILLLMEEKEKAYIRKRLRLVELAVDDGTSVTPAPLIEPVRNKVEEYL